MAFRFRKSFKIAPGVRVNIGKNGLSSMSIGPRGASMSIGSQGKYANIGIPGTGLSFRHRLDDRGNLREEQRLLRVEEKIEKAERRQEALSKVSLSLNENGSINIVNAFSEPLSRADMKLMWEQQEDTILEWLENEMDGINGDIELLENIYQDTSNPNNTLEYKAKEYHEPKPAKLVTPAKPEKEQIPPLGFFASFFKSKKEDHQQKIEEAVNQHDAKLQKWEQAKQQKISKFEKTLAEWEQNKKEYEIQEKYYEENFFELVDSDINFMETLLEDVFNSLSWPRETIVSYEIDDSRETVWIDVDLPEIEDLPQRVADIAATGRKLNIKDKAKKQLQLEYAKHIHGVAFRLVGSSFSALPKVKDIVISGYSQRLDSSTGKVNDDYLFSYKVNKEGFNRIDFDALELLDPIEALNAFEYRKTMTATGIFKAIEAF